MAEKLGVARQTYINIEKGLKELTVSQVKILEDELQVTFEDLLGIGENSAQLDYRKYLKQRQDDGLGGNVILKNLEVKQSGMGFQRKRDGWNNWGENSYARYCDDWGL